MYKSSGQYSIAGILVRTLPADLAQVATRLSALPGVDVHHQEISTGRLVITLEAVELDEERDGLDRIRREMGVVAADLVYHYVEPPDGAEGVVGAPDPGES